MTPEDIKELLDLKAQIEKFIEQNYDKRIKQVGDRVILWDGSGNLDKNSKERRNGIDPLFVDNPAIVIQTNCKMYSEVNDFEKSMKIVPFLLDLLIKFPSGEEVYTSSNFVKRVDNSPV